VNKIRRVDGVKAVGPIGAASVALVSPLKEGADPLNVALLGVEPGTPGEPPAFEGRHPGCQAQAVLDRNVALRGLQGDMLTISPSRTPGAVLISRVGISDGRQIRFSRPYRALRTWEELRPR
jgi:hypothetical protein